MLYFISSIFASQNSFLDLGISVLLQPVALLSFYRIGQLLTLKCPFSLSDDFVGHLGKNYHLSKLAKILYFHLQKIIGART